MQMRKKRILACLLVTMLVAAGCGSAAALEEGEKADNGLENIYNTDSEETTPTEAPTVTTSDVRVNCLSGSSGCYTMDGTTITFSKLSEDSVYSISGQWNGNIVIDVGDEYKLDLEMHGFSVSSDSTNPIMVVSGDRVTITAKKGYVNHIFDNREAVDETEDIIFYYLSKVIQIIILL